MLKSLGSSARKRHVRPLRGKRIEVERADTRNGLVVATFDEVEPDEPLRQGVCLKQLRGGWSVRDDRPCLGDVPALAQADGGTVAVLAPPSGVQRERALEGAIGLGVAAEQPVRLAEVVPFVGAAWVDGHDTLVEARRLLDPPGAAADGAFEEESVGVLRAQAERGTRLGQRPLVVEMPHVVEVAQGQPGLRDLGSESHRALGRQPGPLQATADRSQ